MQHYKIELTINADGSITEKVLASGKNCTAVTEGLENELGQIIGRELLPEYNEPTLQFEDTNNESEDGLWLS